MAFIIPIIIIFLLQYDEYDMDFEYYNKYITTFNVKGIFIMLKRALGGNFHNTTQWPVLCTVGKVWAEYLSTLTLICCLLKAGWRS